jgi:hypothetical protein
MRVLTWIVAAVQLAAAQSAPPLQAPEGDRGLRIDVVEGQGAINNITKGTAWEPIVQVVDEKGAPVQGATVTFLLPSDGAGASFTDDNKVLSVQTDESGRAVAKGMRPNTVAGPFEIHVTATDKGRSGSVVITQTNAAPAQVSAKKSKKGLIILLVAAGAGAGVAVALAGGGSSSGGGTPPPTVTPGTVTPGQPGFGAPH